MKYRIITLLSLFLLTGDLMAKELRVAPGEILLITAELQTLELDTLVLGDDSIVRFAPGVKRWQLTAKRVQIGNHVLIDARGASGAVGVQGADSVAAAHCEGGIAGAKGAAGHDGASGVELSLSWGVAELGSMRLVSEGGVGGSGGRGGRGQRGGDISKCRGGNGGAGGDGGDGGDGGQAGEISLVYWPIGSKVDMSAIAQRLSASSVGGEAGAGGSGGAGGAAVDGRYMKGSFGGNKKWLAGGEPGRPGAKGKTGAAGQDLTPRLQQDFAKTTQRRSASSAVAADFPAKQNKANVALSQRVQQLEKRLELLERRLLKLEQ